MGNTCASTAATSACAGATGCSASNQMGRWWGPGYDGSLMLSTNARPMPALSLDRLRSLPIDLPVLRWLGPWRFTTFFGLGEQHRADVDQPLFMGMRLSFKPATWFEFAMSRRRSSAARIASAMSAPFGRMLIGQDNRGMRGASNDPAKEPGNQMAGFEARIVSPFKPLPDGAVRAGDRRGQQQYRHSGALSRPVRWRDVVHAGFRLDPARACRVRQHQGQVVQPAMRSSTRPIARASSLPATATAGATSAIPPMPIPKRLRSGCR